MATKEELARLKACAAKVSELQQTILRHKRRHESVFATLTQLEKELEDEQSALKDVARGQAVAGRVVTTYKDEYIVVTVTAKQSAVEYDPVKVKKLWPEEVAKKVLRTVVDGKLASEAYEDGDLEAELMQAAALPRESLTPSVSIKVK